LYDVVVTNFFGSVTSQPAQLAMGAYSQLVGNWWSAVATNTAAYGFTNQGPGAFTFGGANVPANAFEAALPLPVTLAPGETLAFSGYLTNALGSFYHIELRWGLLNNNGNQFTGPRNVAGDYGNYLGYWSGAPIASSLAPVYKLPNSSDWWSLTGIGSIGGRCRNLD
jgi:hypothetical protein